MEEKSCGKCRRKGCALCKLTLLAAAVAAGYCLGQRMARAACAQSTPDGPPSACGPGPEPGPEPDPDRPAAFGAAGDPTPTVVATEPRGED